MRKLAVVTTFSKAGYEQYAHRMIASFERLWPSEIDLHIFADEPIPQIKSHRVHYHKEVVKDRDDFVCKFGGNEAAKGIVNGQYNYRFDAVKFCHKPLVLHHFATVYNKGLERPYDGMIWLDADSLTHSRVPLKAAQKQFANPNVDLQYLGRCYKYSECGYIYFNLRNEHGIDVLNGWTDFYRNGTFKKEKEWHDSWLFDIARKNVPKRATDPLHYSLTSHLPRRKGAGHPFVNSFIGEYMDHLKGNARKVTGKPRPNDLMINHSAKYWSENAQRYKNKPKPSRR